VVFLAYSCTPKVNREAEEFDGISNSAPRTVGGTDVSKLPWLTDILYVPHPQSNTTTNKKIGNRKYKESMLIINLIIIEYYEMPPNLLIFHFVGNISYRLH
jgi:hypothetical protein